MKRMNEEEDDVVSQRGEVEEIVWFILEWSKPFMTPLFIKVTILEWSLIYLLFASWQVGDSKIVHKSHEITNGLGLGPKFGLY